MTTSGWFGGEDAEAPALPVTSMLLANRQQVPGQALETALARGRAAEAREAREAANLRADPDERAAAFIGRGLAPGMIFDLGQRLADTMAELAAEEDKIDRTARRQERLQRDHAAGRITAADIARAWGTADEGDQAVVERLRRRADRLRQQMAEAQAMIAPEQERVTDPVEAASRHAHRTFVEVTRQRWAEAQSGRPAPRPFGSASRGAAVRAETVTCRDCIDAGATAEQSYLIHADPDAPAAVRLPVAELTEADLAAFSREEAKRAEITRLVDLGFSPATAELAATPLQETAR